MSKNTNVESALAILAPGVVSQLREQLREEVRAELVSRLSGATPAAPKRKAKAKAAAPEDKQAKPAKPAKRKPRPKSDSAESSESESARRIKTKDGRSASQFIRDLDDSEGELPAADVVARAQEEHGIEIKATLVNNVRTNRRKANGEPKRKPGRKAAAADEADEAAE